jgi:hypothetical protein
MSSWQKRTFILPPNGSNKKSEGEPLAKLIDAKTTLDQIVKILNQKVEEAWSLYPHSNVRTKIDTPPKTINQKVKMIDVQIPKGKEREIVVEKQNPS